MRKCLESKKAQAKARKVSVESKAFDKNIC